MSCNDRILISTALLLLTTVSLAADDDLSTAEDHHQYWEDAISDDLSIEALKTTNVKLGNDGEGRGHGIFLVTKRYTKFQDSSISYCIGLCQYTHRVGYSACYDVCTWNGRSPSPWREFMKNLSKMQPAGRKLSAKHEWYPFRWAARNKLNRIKGDGTKQSRPDRSLPRKGQRPRNREETIYYLWQ